MMDSNGQISDDSGIQRFMSECDLDDLHSETPAPSTYIGSTKTSKGAKTKSALGYEKPIVFDKIFFCSYCLPKIQVKT
jgi:hypothetical protein